MQVNDLPKSAEIRVMVGNQLPALNPKEISMWKFVAELLGIPWGGGWE